MKVLMACYACEPSQGSEPAVGWHWAHEAARAGHEVWVVTRSNNRPAIEASLDRSPSLHFEYLDLPQPLPRWKRQLGHPGLLAYYYLWQIALAFVARRLHRQIRFDLAHHVTFVNDTLPSGLAAVPIPFVWGPVGGSTHKLPKSINLDLPSYARRHELVRSTLQFVLRHVDPFVRLTRRRAKLILVYTNEALLGLTKSELARARVVVHIASPVAAQARRVPGGKQGTKQLHVLTGGRLVHWKGQDLLIQGFAEFVRSRPDLKARLTITGDGPYRPVLERLVDREGIHELVEFVGRLPRRDDVLALMDGCDLYALPTLRDGPPVALLEAMAYAVPVLCVDLGATGELVPVEAGIKIRPTDRHGAIRQIATACRWVAEHPSQAVAMGEAGRKYVIETHQWSHIAAEIERAYIEVTHAGALRRGPVARPEGRNGARRYD